ADPKGDALADERFLVEDFVPDRIEFDIKPEALQVQRGEPLGLGIDGRYLYGAPASGLALEGDVRIRPKRELDAYKGFRFGLADQVPEPTFEVLQDLPDTDEKGVAHVVVAAETLPDWSGPLEATVNIRLREGGGRAVERSQKFTIAPEGAQIGIRPLFDGDEVREGSDAGFEVIAIGADGRRKAVGEAGWSLVRIERDYQWYRGDSGWNYEPVDYARRIADGRIAIGTEAAEKITVPVDWGRYRLEVAGDEAASPASSVEFNAGWYVPQASTETPNGLEVALDKAQYLPGETANLKISPRYAGTAIVVTGTDRVIDVRAIEVPRQGTSVGLPVTAEWGTGAYAMVTLIRPAGQGDARLPQRAIGIAHASIDPAAKKLAVTIVGEEQARPNGPVSVAVQVTGLAAGKTARVMLAAVDVGILNLTRYEPPRPEDWFFGQQRLGLELRDLYGRLIDGSKGVMGAIRTGGDAAGLGMEGSPPTQPLMAYFSGIVPTDATGKADITFNVPQFNGTVRLMAVAFTEAAVGSGNRDMIVREPVVVVASHPQFLAPGDEARLWLDITNTDAEDGEYQLAISASPELAAPLAPGSETFTLKKGARTNFIVPLIARRSGPGSLAMRLYREGGENIEQVISIPVRSPRQPVSERKILSLKARGGSVTLDKDFLAGFEAAGTKLTAAVSRAAGLDVASLLVQLDRYPYGCAEQTTSKAFPLLYLSEVATAMGLGDEAGIRDKVQKAVDRVLSFQGSNGSFGLWGPGSEDLWLDSYVTDFLTRAREKGYDVPDIAFTQAIDNLHNALGYDIDLKTDSAKVAYALYVLARNKKASLGDLRYYSDAQLAEFTSPMAK
ncbi:MAG TPA: alpha-2-macroglobulin family protein, partial [Kiloniellales bacterium]